MNRIPYPTTFYLTIILVFFSLNVKAQVGQILWEDDFNSINKDIWSVDIGDGCPELCGWGNNELQSYQDENIYIEEITGDPGNFGLVIEAKNEILGDKAFTSGKVTTRNNLGLKYGMVEIRMKAPDDISTGLWPAAWLLGTNEVSDGWPLCGEIDMMEMGQSRSFQSEQELPSLDENNLVGSNLIFYDDAACSNENQDCAASIAFDKYYNQPYYQSSTLTDRFLIYRMYWDEKEIRLTVEDNGNIQNFYTGPFPIGGSSTEFNKPFYLLLNLAVGGNFTNASNASQVTAQLPGKMYIDYVRVRQWNGRGEVFTPEKLMANAGADKSINDGENVILNSAGSYGPIANYSWRKNGVEIASTATHSVNLEAGNHTFSLMIMDDAGNTATDQVTISINNPGVGNVLWEDNFNTLDPEIWKIDQGDGCDEGICGWGNAELQSYEEDNVYIEEIAEDPGNFALVIEAKREQVGNSEFSSGKVTTENNVAIQYGVVEVRMKVPNLQNGLWPAAWLLGINHRTAGWPTCGEIDMMEMGHAASVRAAEGHSGSVNNFVGGNVLWYTGAACDAQNLSCAASIAFDKNYTTPYVSGNGLNNRYMTYRIYWDDSQIRMTAIDNGQEFDLYTNPFPLGSGQEAFKKPFYFLLNLAIGGNFTGLLETEDITFPTPAKMYIDYVKVSEWNGQGEVTFPGNNQVANAGGDISKDDLDKDGIETVTLDGSNSYGNITTYEWSENGVVLSQDKNVELTLTSGIHNIQLKVADDQGNYATDFAKVDIREILWEDNFDSFDTNVWTAESGDGCPELCGWGNQELQSYQRDNISIVEMPNDPGNKALAIEARNETVGDKAFTSARVKTEGNLSVKYGLVEIRMKAPDDLSTGLWPAAWLLGTNLQEVGWPRSGEIDMMEMGHRAEFREIEGYPDATENDIVGGNIIFYSDAACSGDNADCAASIAFDKYYNKPYRGSTPLTQRFLTYRMYWDPNQIRLTAEDMGVEFDLYTGPFPLGQDAEEFHKPFFLLLNLAVGGNFTDASTNGQVTANLPGQMLVDYVRIFKWNGFGEVANASGLVANAGADIIKLDDNGDGTEIITLDASGSAHHSGNIDNYAWSIDGKEVATKRVAPITLSRGTHTAVLTVTDDKGNTANDEVLITISNGGLAPVANAGADQMIEDDDEDDLANVNLDGSGSEASNSPIVSYQWLANDIELATGVTANIQLSTGIHEITLKVVDEDDLIGEDEVIITVIDPNNIAPIARAGDDQSINDDNEDDLANVTLDASSSSDEDGTIATYRWLLDDEEIAVGKTADIELTTGIYNITLSVTDDDGQSSTDDIKITILDPDNAAPIAVAGEDQRIPDADLDTQESVTLDGTASTDADGSITDYVWKQNSSIIGSEVTLDLTLELGQHDFTLEVTDDDGITSTDEVTIIISQLPIANAGEDVIRIDEDENGVETVGLDGSTSFDPDGEITSYSWLFENNEIANSASTSFDFPVGANKVSLQVVDNFGFSATDTVTVFVSNINNMAPTANAGEDFTITEDDGDGFLYVSLDGSLSTDADGTIFKYDWYENDMIIGSGAKPIVTLAVGEHNIVLAVTDDQGATDRDEITVIVTQRLNLALNRPVIVSSEEGPATEGTLAVDGDYETRWSSLFSDPQWIYVDFGAEYTINQVVLHWEAAYGANYEIQISADATNWRTVYSATAGDGGQDDISLTGNGQFVRMYGTTRGTEFGYSLFEIEIYGDPLSQEAVSSLSDLKVDNVTVRGFNSTTLDYTISLPEGETNIPVVSAVATNPNATMSIIQASSLPGEAKVSVTSEDGTNTLDYTIVFSISTPSANLALGKNTFTSSDETGETLGPNAVDGQLNTRWASAFSDPQWIYIDLESTYDIGRIVLTWEAAFATNYEIQVSSDANNWSTIYTETAGNGDVDEISASGNGRYVRMYGTTRATPYGYSLYEFEIYEEETQVVFYDVTFLVTDESGDFISDASVSLLNDQGTTNMNGSVVFQRLLPQNNVSYQVSKTNYQSTSGTVDITGDLAKTVVLQMIEQPLTSLDLKEAWTIYPNPPINTITIEYPTYENVKVELINISGKVLLTQDLTETLNTLAIDHLKAGVYFLRASGPAGTNIKRFIKGK